MFVAPFANPFPGSIRKPKPTIQKSSEKKYLNFMADRQGCGMWRIGFQEYFINMNSRGESTSVTKMITDPNWYRDISVVKVQRQASSEQKKFLTWLSGLKKEMGFKMIYEVDDVVFHEEIPDYNIYKAGFANDEIRQNCIDMINLCDEVTVTCEFMRDLYREKSGKQEISVVPNFPPYWWFGHQYNYKRNIDNFDKNKKKPRIVYAGSGAHFDVGNNTDQQDDFTHVNDFVIRNIDKYQFVFIGAVPLRLQSYVSSGKIEFHPWKTLIEYPNFLANLNAQLFIAPLQENNFNRSKSDIKFVEAACLGIPCLCQDMVTYSCAPDFLKFKTGDELEEKVEKLLNWKNRSKYYSLLPQLREFGESRFLEREENIGGFLEIMDTPYGSPLRHHSKRWNP